MLIDSGGNTGSVLYALERLGVMAAISADPQVIASADRVILPGVGAAAPAMARLQQLDLTGLIRDLRQPLLGICLGMQLLYESSEEGDVECLGILHGQVTRLLPEPGIRLPHMGWNELQMVRDDPLVAGVADGEQAYFVHGYAAPLNADVIATSTHGRRFPAVVGHGNHYGAQFHPERSSALGARVLQNFLSDAVA